MEIVLFMYELSKLVTNLPSTPTYTSAPNTVQAGSTGTLVTWLLDLYGLVQFPRGPAERSTHTAEAPVGFGYRGGGRGGQGQVGNYTDLWPSRPDPISSGRLWQRDLC